MIYFIQDDGTEIPVPPADFGQLNGGRWKIPCGPHLTFMFKVEGNLTEDDPLSAENQRYRQHYAPSSATVGVDTLHEVYHHRFGEPVEIRKHAPDLMMDRARYFSFIMHQKPGKTVRQYVSQNASVETIKSIQRDAPSYPVIAFAYSVKRNETYVVIFSNLDAADATLKAINRNFGTLMWHWRQFRLAFPGRDLISCFGMGLSSVLSFLKPGDYPLTVLDPQTHLAIRQTPSLALGAGAGAGAGAGGAGADLSELVAFDDGKGGGGLVSMRELVASPGELCFWKPYGLRRDVDLAPRSLDSVPEHLVDPAYVEAKALIL
jgi:hypothetical protein